MRHQPDTATHQGRAGSQAGSTPTQAEILTKMKRINGEVRSETQEEAPTVPILV